MSVFAQSRSTQKLLFFTQKRFSVRQSIHRHTEPSKFKKHMLSACEPYFKRDYRLPEETCKKAPSDTKRELLPLEKIFANELLQDFETSECILFLQYTYTPFQSDRVYKNKITKSGCKFQNYNNNIYKKALEDYNCDERAINLLNYSRHALITGLVENMPECLKLLRRMPQYILLAGYVDRELFNVDQLGVMSATTGIDQCRANLLAVLDTPAIDLSYNLEQYSDIIKPTDQ